MPIGDNIPARMPESSGTTYYVDKDHGSASDANAGTSESLPWATMTKAFTDAPANAIVRVKAAATPYSEGVNDVERGGTNENNVITIEAYDPANKPTYQGEVDFNTTGAHHWRIRNIRFDHNGGSGRGLGMSTGAHHIEAYGCEAFGSGAGGSGFQTRENPGPTEFIWFINCLSHSNGIGTSDHGWYHNGGRNVYYINCISRDNAGYGFHVYNGSGSSHKINGVYFFNCLADGNVLRGGWLISSDTTQANAEADPTLLAQNVHLYNCMSTNHPGSSTSFGYRVRYGSLTNFAATGATPSTINDSLSFNNNSGDTSVSVPTAGDSVIITNLITGQNPLYVDAGANDFHLQTSSPAHDAGSLEDTPTFDYDEAARILATLGPYMSPDEVPPEPPTVEASVLRPLAVI